LGFPGDSRPSVPLRALPSPRRDDSGYVRVVNNRGLFTTFHDPVDCFKEWQSLRPNPKAATTLLRHYVIGVCIESNDRSKGARGWPGPAPSLTCWAPIRACSAAHVHACFRERKPRSDALDAAEASAAASTLQVGGKRKQPEEEEEEAG
jgi:hypothetical protein